MPRIMIIDDDAALREALTIRLKAAGFEVIASAHPDAALQPVLRLRPDLLLLDIDMPCYSGLDFHQCLRVTDRGRNIPVVYLSGHDTPSHRQEAFKQGARAFLTKPYDADTLLATINGVLQAEASRQETLAGH